MFEIISDQPNKSGYFITIGWIVMGCPLYMYFVINVQEQGRRYEAIASVTVGMVSDSAYTLYTVRVSYSMSHKIVISETN